MVHFHLVPSHGEVIISPGDDDRSKELHIVEVIRQLRHKMILKVIMLEVVVKRLLEHIEVEQLGNLHVIV